jgi:hypothetical protein
MFLMVLSWSRGMHALFTLDQKQDNFLRGHVAAFEYFGGVPRVLLYDNPRSVVLSRIGDATRFHPKLFVKSLGKSAVLYGIHAICIWQIRISDEGKTSPKFHFRVDLISLA